MVGEVGLLAADMGAQMGAQMQGHPGMAQHADPVAAAAAAAAAIGQQQHLAYAAAGHPHPQGHQFGNPAHFGHDQVTWY